MHTPLNLWDSEPFNFDSGRSYLVYAYTWKGGLATNGCTWTQPLAEAGEDIKALDTFATAKTAR